MEEQQGTVGGSAGRSIFYRSLRPARPAAAVLVVHGYAEHSGRYAWVLGQLAGAGYAAVAPDYCGHGRSVPPGGTLADLRSVEAALADLRAVHEAARSELAGLPWFVLGHSLGGALGLLYALRHQAELQGLVASAPLSSLPAYASPLLVRLIRVLSRVVPLLPVQKFDFLTVSRSPEVIEAIRQDPLYYKGKARVRTGYQLMRSIQEVGSRMGELRLPLLALQGGEDTLVNRGDARRVYEGAGSRDKSLKEFPGLYHEIFNEPERQQVMDVVLDWLRRRLG